MSAPLHDIRTLAIILPSWVGDCVMATPCLRALRENLRGARIVGFMRRGLDDVLRGTSWLDEMIVADMKGLAGPLRLARAVRQVHADAVLLFPNSFRAALAARFAGAPTRVGYARDGRTWLLTHSLVRPPQTPIAAVDYYAAFTRFALGLGSFDLQLELGTTAEEESAADELLHDVRGPLVLLNPGANRPDKRWPAHNFAQLADRLASSPTDIAIAITGSPSESELLKTVTRAAKTPILNLAPRGITLSSLKAVIKRAALLITNDTGPRHIAAALGTPVITLFGPTDHRWTTLANLVDRERILIAEPFLPEELVADRHAAACAIGRIPVADVLHAAESMLDRKAT